MTNSKRTSLMIFRCTPEEKTIIELAAMNERLSASAFIRIKSLGDAK